MTAPSGIQIADIAAPSPNVMGGIWRAPLNTTAPIDTSTVLATPFVSLGYVDDDGVTLNIDRPSTKQYAWGGSLVAALQQHYAATFTFKLYQIVDPDVQKVIHSDANVTVTAATSTTGTITTVKMNAVLNVNSMWVIEGYYQNVSMRLVVPNARVTQVGNFVLTHKSLAVYPATLEAFPDNNGDFVTIITDDGIHT